ncbi:MAG: type II toxin-antitoxin system Phd/YefM family antitoxin [Nitrospirota bacterium]
MTRTMPIVEARKKLTSLPEEFEKEPETDAVAVTRRGKPVLALMSWDVYESLVETLEIMGDKDLMADLRRSIREVREGKTIPWERVKKDLGL